MIKEKIYVKRNFLSHMLIFHLTILIILTGFVFSLCITRGIHMKIFNNINDFGNLRPAKLLEQIKGFLKVFKSFHSSKYSKISRLYPHIWAWILTVFEVSLLYFFVIWGFNSFFPEPPILITMVFNRIFFLFCYVTSMFYFYWFPKRSSLRTIWICLLVWIVTLFGIPLTFLAWFRSPLKGLVLGLYLTMLIVFVYWIFKQYNSKLSSLYSQTKFLKSIKRKIYSLNKNKRENNLVRKKLIMSLKLSLFYSTFAIFILTSMVYWNFVTNSYLFGSDVLPINKMISQIIAVEKLVFNMGLISFLTSIYITLSISLTFHFMLEKLETS